jgi:Na+/citrate or Na+/malate symporter
VYRELRTLSAGISNATAIERVFEMILNTCFYAILFFICLAILGIGALTFALTFSSIILALSFIIGSASSSMFEGILMILVRRPYGTSDIRLQNKFEIIVTY